MISPKRHAEITFWVDDSLKGVLSSCWLDGQGFHVYRLTSLQCSVQPCYVRGLRDKVLHGAAET